MRKDHIYFPRSWIAAGAFLFAVWPFSSKANVVGSDAQNFNPTTSGLDFVTVQSSETLAPGVFNLGLFANYAKNTFPYYEGATGTATRVERNNSLIGGDFNLGFGLTKNWDAGLSFPFILSQTVSDTDSVGHYSTTGNTEIRINTKYRLFGSQSQGVALVASANFNRIANNPFMGEGGGPIYNLELAADTTISQVAIALNLGRRWRNPGKPLPASGVEPIPDQWLASTAMSYHIDPIDTKIIFEVLAAIPAAEKLTNATDREYSVMEALLGLKHDTSSNLSLHLGAGTGLMKGVSSPDLRIYGGLNVSFGPLFGTRENQKTDPYSDSQARAAAQKRKIRRLRPKPPTSVATSTLPAAPTSTPIPVPKVIEDTPPSVGVETVQQVPVINRGSYNHIVLNSIEFVSNTLALKPESVQYFMSELLPALRELNRRRPIETIVVEGHTDSNGSEALNQKLSEERAEIVGNLLRKNLGLNIPIQTVGLGESSPIADNGNYQGRELNRRVEFKIVYKRSSR